MNELNGPANRLVSVHYPGIVKNESKMLETLGGLATISNALKEKNLRLELRMRPKDAFCKPAYGTRKPTAALVLKIKVKKKTNSVVSFEILGHVSEEFRFSGMCDFQFLPMSRDECLFGKVIPSTLDSNWLSNECSLFLPPAVFSRVDGVQNYSFSKGTGDEDSHVIGRITRKRYGCTKFLQFEDKEVPMSPKQASAGGVQPAKLVTADMVNQIKKLFDERPIYSRAAILNVSQLPPHQLKVLIPCVAYYFTNGPWRGLWVKFGYDPRVEPAARFYQTLDYRIRSGIAKQEVKLKRSNTMATVPRKLGAPPVRPVIGMSASPEKQADKFEPTPHIFKPGEVPPARQCYYQYCDIAIPEIQAKVEAAQPAEECHEIHGWMPFNLADDCRQIMNTYIVEELKRRGGEGVMVPSPPPRDGSDQDSDYCESVLSFLG